MSRDDLMWLAGLLEGEGCFRYQESPMIELQMTDEDVVARAAQIVDRKYSIKSNNTKAGKTVYHLRFFSQHAVNTMYALYPFMGKRRQGQINVALEKFKAQSQVTPRIETEDRVSILNDLRVGTLSIADIARKYSRPYGTIYTIASRGGWR